MTMRKELEKIGKETRNRYKATVVRMGIKSNNFKNFPERTILLGNVVDVSTGKVVTDHLWFTVHKTLKKLNLREEDEISFNARVGSYRKGHKRKNIDYKLNNMSKIVVEKRTERELTENEITSSTPPSFQELREAQARKQQEIEEERYREDIEMAMEYFSRKYEK